LLLAADKELLPINPSHINKSMQVPVEVRWITNWRSTATSQLQAAPTPQSVAAASSSSWSSSARRLFVRSSFVAWTDSSESVMHAARHAWSSLNHRSASSQSSFHGMRLDFRSAPSLLSLSIYQHHPSAGDGRHHPSCMHARWPGSRLLAG